MIAVVVVAEAVVGNCLVFAERFGSVWAVQRTGGIRVVEASIAGRIVEFRRMLDGKSLM